jgi:hypothetical protein
MRALIFLAAAAIACALSACAPPPQIITRPVYIDRPRNVVQPIPAELLREHPIAEGLRPSECLSVAAQRKAELMACNGDKAALRARAGTVEQGDE